MEFTIDLILDCEAGNYTAGLNTLDKARNALGPHIQDANWVKVSSNEYDRYRIRLSEEEARACHGVFNGRQAVYMNVLANHLEDFYRWSDKGDGKAVFALSKTALIDGWIADGCPSKWRKAPNPQPKQKKEWARLLRPFYGKVDG